MEHRTSEMRSGFALKTYAACFFARIRRTKTWQRGCSFGNPTYENLFPLMCAVILLHSVCGYFNAFGLVLFPFAIWVLLLLLIA